MRRPLWSIVVIASLFLAVHDRIRFADNAQWLYDQSATLWISSRIPLALAPVGLVSSTGVPNLNGMILFTKLLVPLNEPFLVSTALGLFQLVALLFFCLVSSSRPLVGFLLAAICSVCVVTHASSVELWNQWSIAPFILIALGFIALFTKTNRAGYLILSWAIILWLPLLYLGGLGYVFGFLVTSLVAIHHSTFNRTIGERSIVKRLMMMSLPLLIFTSSLWCAIQLSVVPFIDEYRLLKFQALEPMIEASFLESLRSLALALVLPMISPIHEALFFEHFVRRDVTIRVLSYGSAAAALSMMLLALVGMAQRAGSHHISSERFSLYSLLFVISSSVGVWFLVYVSGNSLRPDQLVPLTPLILTVLCHWIVTSKSPGPVHMLGKISLCVFVLTNLLLSRIIPQFALDDRLHPAATDVPLQTRGKIVEYINTQVEPQIDLVALDYDTGQGHETVLQYSTMSNRWFASPYSVGRAIDTILYNRSALTNYQEGVQFRYIGSGQFILSYGTNRPSPIRNDLTVPVLVRNKYIGQYRLSINESARSSAAGRSCPLYWASVLDGCRQTPCINGQLPEPDSGLLRIMSFWIIWPQQERHS